MLGEADDTETVVSAADSLVSSGELDEGWSSRMKLLVARDAASTGASWSPRYFRSLHFASMYLPLRYLAWHRATGQRRTDTEKTLMEVGRAVEVSLWAQAAAASGAAMHEEDRQLTYWVFDGVNKLHEDPAFLVEWESEYLHLLERVSVRWRGASLWPKWATMAINFASFYLDIALLSIVDVSEARPLSNVEEDTIQMVKSAGGTLAASIVGVWLGCPILQRDDGGTVLAGSPRHGARKTRVRTASEVLLMRAD